MIRPALPLPSLKGCIASNWKWAIAIFSNGSPGVAISSFRKAIRFSSFCRMIPFPLGGVYTDLPAFGPLRHPAVYISALPEDEFHRLSA